MSAAPIPDEVLVGPFVYTIATDELSVLRETADVGTETYGRFDVQASRIVIDVTGSPMFVRETLTHELIHALADMTGVATNLGDKEEERTVRVLAPALLDLLRRNPKLVAYLTGP